ncbi:MAG: hypothetical protein A2705_04920 [Omnitrophica WOR_2 bacterium RIFCSPHIGHO2_01_FULL_52_10]|nr:MAG: hypothetical protein A2705_04920 [Omnitrophica WOR_2 bacterium RIFCSPHIGHO2_01_FULL_52_10]
MRLKNYPAAKLKRELLEIIERHIDLAEYGVFFFGSRLEARGDERSDIDLGIEGPRPIPAGALARIREEIERMPLLYKIDVVDFRDAAEDFRRVALQKVEWIHVPRRFRKGKS